jgi:hypothetical protein
MPGCVARAGAGTRLGPQVEGCPQEGSLPGGFFFAPTASDRSGTPMAYLGLQDAVYAILARLRGRSRVPPVGAGGRRSRQCKQEDTQPFRP